MSKWQNAVELTKISLFAILFCGCSHARLENWTRLTERTDFPTAVEAAPEWVEDALITINKLEYELEKQ